MDLPTDGLPLQGSTICIGASGSGKSNVLMSQIIRRLRDGQQLYCIDTKDEIAPLFGRHMEVVGTDKAEETLQKMLRIAEERRNLFSDTAERLERPCRDFGEYFKLTQIKLPVVTCVLEELIVLMTIIDQASLVKLLVTGRSAGVFVFALSQYLKADILDRRGSVNFNTRIFMGKYDQMSVKLLFGTLSAEDTKTVKEFVGSPGKAVVEESGTLVTRTMPRVEDTHIIPYMRRG